MSNRPIIITPGLIRRHNLRCAARILLWLLGSSAVFLVVFLFAWLIASLVVGHSHLTWPILVFALLVGLGLFTFGHLHLRKHGPRDWEKIARKPDRREGMRLARMSNQEYGQIGQGLWALVLSGPGWLGRVVDEWRAVIPATEEMAERLETLRQHFAAREAWVPMKDFQTHEAGIYLLAKLDILAIREMLGEWHFHPTIHGTVNRKTEVNRGA